MKTITYDIETGKPIGNLYRKKHALILIGTEDGKYILCRKEGYYPGHIARMIGGGINGGESAAMAALREIREEVNLSISKKRLIELATVRTNAQTIEGKMSMSTHIYYLEVTAEEEGGIVPNDDITGIQKLSTEDLGRLISSMELLDGSFEGVSGGKTFTFDWIDWGRVYAPIHKVALTHAEQHRGSL